MPGQYVNINEVLVVCKDLLFSLLQGANKIRSLEVVAYAVNRADA